MTLGRPRKPFDGVKRERRREQWRAYKNRLRIKKARA